MSTIIEIMRSLGRSDALRLRSSASTMTGTEIIASEHCIPAWDAAKDYSSWPVGAPVMDEDQVWLLLQPHNASHFIGRPSEMRALWGIAHTKDPSKAKPWIDAYGTSGMYMTDECYIDSDGKVFRCKQDNTVHNATSYPTGWEEVSM